MTGLFDTTILRTCQQCVLCTDAIRKRKSKTVTPTYNTSNTRICRVHRGNLGHRVKWDTEL